MLTIDCRMADHSGIGTYIKNLVPRLASRLTSLSLTLMGAPDSLRRLLVEYGATNVSFLPFDEPIYSIREQLTLPFAIPRSTKLFWAPHYNIPALYPGRILTTVHDICHLAIKDVHASPLVRMYAALMFRAVRRRSIKIVTVSEFTKSELVSKLGYDPQAVQVIWNGVDDVWRRSRIADGYREPYLVYVGNIKPHKNLKRLVKAFQRISRQIPHKLLLVGRYDGFVSGFQDLDELMPCDRIELAGELDQDDLIRTVAGASALIMPSLYEGFGLPAAEAMSCGCPVLAANATSLPEVCGKAAFYFDPYSVDDMAGTILDFVRDEGGQARLKAEGYRQAESFDWSRAADQLCNLVTDII
ncbi:glycosyltransferase family 4 protein [Pseudodesulfovibrio methanolicus]|uniref:Glycosyltransferase family 1 protein n=1 Tax=Pseudodesulfovibrio methanolicus TaxID=3126690 RepID=A0ABZ2IXA7_9BACT